MHWFARGYIIEEDGRSKSHYAPAHLTSKKDVPFNKDIT